MSPLSRHLALLFAAPALVFVGGLAALPAVAQNDSRQVGPLPAVKGAPPMKRNAASPHPNCVRDKMGKCDPTASAKKHARSR